MEVVGYKDETKMPPDGKLPDADTQILREWIRRGRSWETPERLLTFTIVLPGFIRRKAACEQRNAPRRPTRITSPHVPTFISVTWASSRIAALFTRASSWVSSLKNRLTDASSPTSKPEVRLRSWHS